MEELFKKLNVLIRSSLNDLIPEGRAADAPEARARRDLEREVAHLRGRIRDALDYEDQLKAHIVQLTEEAQRLDAEADQAVRDGREAEARYLIERLRRTEQRLAMAQSDLHEHQVAASGLIEQVSRLEAYVEQAKQARASAEPALPVTQRIADTLRAARESLGSERPSANRLAQDDAPAAVDKRAVEDDLARRRERLSKR